MKMQSSLVRLLLLIVCELLVTDVLCAGKYSKEANQQQDATPEAVGDDDSVFTVDKPFRMNKVNLLWAKAKQRLGHQKLKILAEELKAHDKEEIILKKVKADGGDKEGLKEAEVRKKFHNIMSRFDLLKHVDVGQVDRQPKAFNEPHEDVVNKAVFKDKKLNKLWLKAQQSEDFSIEELMTLKQEFKHHQEKVDVYYQLLNQLHSDNATEQEQLDNSIYQYLDSESKSKSSVEERVQSLRDKHVELKKAYDELNSKAIGGSSSAEFKDPKVKILWKLAKEADFNSNELESLKEELEHYEQRVIKLSHLESELTIMNKKSADDDDVKAETKKHLEKKVKQLNHKVNKLHGDLEGRIKERHSEL